ncbi:hypothetical protein LA080_016066 [Diaporthe eres]|nr:hypothetical protein LA080_016066 [Diaporthe eres]
MLLTQEKCRADAEEEEPGRQHSTAQRSTAQHSVAHTSGASLVVLQVRAGQPASHTGCRAVPAAMSPTSRLISPTPRPRPNHDCSLVCFWKGGKGFHLLLGKPPPKSLGRRHCSAVVLIGSTRDSAVHCNPSHLPHAGSGAVVTSPARDTHHTIQARQARAPPSPPHPAHPTGLDMPRCLLEAPPPSSITREHDIRQAPFQKLPSYTGKVSRP